MFTVATLKELAPQMGGLKSKTVIVTMTVQNRYTFKTKFKKKSQGKFAYLLPAKEFKCKHICLYNMLA